MATCRPSPDDVSAGTSAIEGMGCKHPSPWQAEVEASSLTWLPSRSSEASASDRPPDRGRGQRSVTAPLLAMPSKHELLWSAALEDVLRLHALLCRPELWHRLQGRGAGLSGGTCRC